MNRFDELLFQSLSPREEPDEALNRKIIDNVKEKDKMNKRVISKKLIAIVACAVIAVTSVTAVAAVRYFSADSIAEHLGDATLSENFISSGENPEPVTVEDAGYRVMYFGLLSGEGLSDFEFRHNGELRNDRTYIAVAVEHTDGTPMTDDDELFISPLIGSLNPALYNIVTFNGGYSQFIEDGVLYRLIESENIECFADSNIYLCVTTGWFYENGRFVWDEATETIAPDESYDGLNVLFTLDVDESKADSVKAAEIIGEFGDMTDN